MLELFIEIAYNESKQRKCIVKKVMGQMGAKVETGKIEYHYGFYGAVHVEYEPRHVKMEYLQEHELGDEPVRMDMLIIKRDEDALKDPIGSFFRTHNVLEYKSPKDSLSIDDFYKAQGYALLYKGLGKQVNEIPIEELTVSIFRQSYPREMLANLKAGGLTVENAYPGIYRFSGALSVPTQVVVISRLPQGEYSAFKALGENATKEDLIELLQLADSLDQQMLDYIRAVLNVSMVLNRQIIAEIKEAGIMPEAIKAIFKEDFQKERAEGRAEGRVEGRVEILSNLVKDGILSAGEAAKRLNMTEREFLKAAGLYLAH